MALLVHKQALQQRGSPALRRNYDKAECKCESEVRFLNEPGPELGPPAGDWLKVWQILQLSDQGVQKGKVAEVQCRSQLSIHGTAFKTCRSPVTSPLWETDLLKWSCKAWCCAAHFWSVSRPKPTRRSTRMCSQHFLSCFTNEFWVQKSWCEETDLSTN